MNKQGYVRERTFLSVSRRYWHPWRSIRFFGFWDHLCHRQYRDGHFRSYQMRNSAWVEKVRGCFHQQQPGLCVLAMCLMHQHLDVSPVIVRGRDPLQNLPSSSTSWTWVIAKLWCFYPNAWIQTGREISFPWWSLVQTSFSLLSSEVPQHHAGKGKS